MLNEKTFLFRWDSEILVSAWCAAELIKQLLNVFPLITSVVIVN